MKNETTKDSCLIFLCHADEDKKHVRELYQKLKEANYLPWLDEIHILPGQDWDYEIKQALKKSTFILICLSDTSVVKRGYLNKEIKWALERQDEMLTGDIFIIPVKLTPCELPYALENIQSVDLFKPNGFARLQQAIDFQLDGNQGDEKNQKSNAPSSEFHNEEQAYLQAENSQLHATKKYSASNNTSISTTQKTSLVTYLLECAAIRDRQTRDAILDELPADIKHTIHRHSSDRVDVNNIVSRCMDFGNGLSTFVSIIENFEGQTEKMKKVNHFFNELRK